MKNISYFHNIDTLLYNYWYVNPMTINDLQKFCLGSIDHNMALEATLGSWV